LTLVGAAVVTFATSSGEIAYTFSNMYVGDLMGDLLKLLLYLTVIVVCSIRAATSSNANRWPGRVLRPGAVRHARHDGHDFGQSLPDRLYRSRTAVTLALCDGGDES
jgi:hypothetical protein